MRMKTGGEGGSRPPHGLTPAAGAGHGEASPSDPSRDDPRRSFFSSRCSNGVPCTGTALRPDAAGQ